MRLVDLFCCPVLEPGERQGKEELINVQHGIVLPLSGGRSPELLIRQISPHFPAFSPVALSHSRRRPDLHFSVTSDTQNTF